MDYKRIFTVAIIGSLLTFTSCSKEDVKETLSADIETYSGTQKAFVDDNNFSCFSSGDAVNINGTNVTVSNITRNGRQVEFDVEKNSVYNAVYPSVIVKNNSVNANNTQNIAISLPEEQVYVMENNRQKINIPMAARLTSSTGTLHFHNLCALLNVTVTNSTGKTLTFKSLEISNANCPLSGNGVIDNLASSTPKIMLNNNSSKVVKLTFPTVQTLANGAAKSYYVVIPQSAASTNFTVSVITNVQVEGATPGSYQILKYAKTRTNAFSFNRNVIYNIAFAAETNPVVHSSGIFSVSATKKVYFSIGNLWYNGNDGTWNFEDEQWKGHTYNETAGTYGNTQGLFQWPTSQSNYGRNITGAASQFMSSVFVDWGNNIIKKPDGTGNFAANEWRTLTWDEWVYCCNTRTNAANLSRYYVLWNGQGGFIIMPDDWTGSFSVAAQGQISETEWRRLESEGAMFMPSIGMKTTGGNSGNQALDMWNGDTYSTNTCAFYWSSTTQLGPNVAHPNLGPNDPNGGGYSVQWVATDNYMSGSGSSGYQGHCVRLVKDVQ